MRQFPYAWIARRARRIETFYGLWAGRRMAIQLAVEDWRSMNPTMSLETSD